MSAPRRIAAERLNATPSKTGGAGSTTGGHRLTLFGAPLELPSPRAMAVAVMALLAFGVIVGTSSLSLASSPLQVTLNRPANPVAAATTTPLAGPSPSSNPAPTAGGGSSPSPASPSGASPAPASSPPSSSTPASSTPTTTSSATSSDGLPPIKHVWVIELGDQGYASTFDRGSPDTYLNATLAKQGQVVPDVYASATSDLANEVGLLSGQGPTLDTEADCPTYTAIKSASKAGAQVRGSGCVYPKSTPSIVSELTKAGDTWKAYVQGLGTTAAAGCIRPTLGSTDRRFIPKSTAGYVTWRNPLVYLAGVTSLKSCGSDDTGLAALAGDLKTVESTPNLSLIFPNSCDDGSDTPCRTGAAAGTTQSDKFLKSIVPKIMASSAYKQDGMILITFAQAPQSGTGADHSSCCDQPTKFPNLPSADYVPTTGPGGATTTTNTGTTPETTATGTAPAASSTTTSVLGAAATVGTTTQAAGVTPGATTTATGTTGTSTTACPTTTTGADTTTTASTTTDTGTSTTASDGCCPAAATTPTTTTTVTTTATTSTTTAAGTGTTAASACCPSATSTDATTTGTNGTPTNTTTTPTTASTTGATPTDSTATTTTTTDCPTTTTPETSSGPGSPTGGGGQVGMLVLSQYVTKNLQDGTDAFNTFSITGSLEQLFGLKYTGYADISGLPLFSGFFYSNYQG